jgi:hypothetical protein
VELPIAHRDVTTVMRMLDDIQQDVARIRREIVEDDDGEADEEGDA